VRSGRAEAAAAVPAVLACPVCAEPLLPGDHTFRCPNAHGFDVAREGYVNLLLAQHRNSKDPGYSKEMIAGRRDFFEAGHYAPLADDLSELLVGSLPATEDAVVLDAGCGEGYYLRRLRLRLARGQAVAEPLLVGLDISKHGIRIAARRDPLGQYAVAGTYRMPVLPRSVDVLLTHFSPVSPADFRRVVRPGGVVLVGGPGAGHLFSFKELLYDAPARHESVEPLADEPGFELVAQHRIRHPLALRGPEQVANLLLMTPFFWTLSAEAQARLGEVTSLDTEIDVVVRAYRRLPDAAG
jgi:23S rRNA (guanine745-N1)-methyltransferase